MITPIQGNDATLYVFTNGWVPFVCASSVSMAFDADLVPIRTVGDGQWKKYDYQALSYSLTLGDVLVFDDVNFNGWQIMQNQIGFLTLPFRMIYTDANGVSNGVQGTAVFKSVKFDMKVGQVVQGNYEITGSGAVIVFEGVSPCDTTIDSITVNGASSASGSVTVGYTYTGDLMNVVYQIDGAGAWITAAGATALNLLNMPVGSHSIQIIPVCANGYQGAGMTQTFIITQGLTCSSFVASMTIGTPTPSNFSNLSSGVSTQVATSTYALPNINGSAPFYLYIIDTGPATLLPAGTPIPINNLSPGVHTIYFAPVCIINGQQVQGTAGSGRFTLISNAGQTVVNYNLTAAGLLTPNFQIYVNNVLTITGGAQSGTLNVPVGSVVRVVTGVQRNIDFFLLAFITQVVQDQTTNTTLSNLSTNAANPSLTYTFTTNSDTFNITMTLANHA